MTVNVASGVAAGGVVAVYRISGLVRRKYSCVTAWRRVDVQVERNVILKLISFSFLSRREDGLDGVDWIELELAVLKVAEAMSADDLHVTIV